LGRKNSDDFKPFLRIRKNKVLAALQWLVSHNYHYEDVNINHSLLSSWAEDFIPPQISANISYMNDSDHSEREGYVVNLEKEILENDFQAATDDTSDDNSPTTHCSNDVSKHTTETPARRGVRRVRTKTIIALPMA
jgi:hypothetical protein